MLKCKLLEHPYDFNWLTEVVDILLIFYFKNIKIWVNVGLMCRV